MIRKRLATGVRVAMAAVTIALAGCGPNNGAPSTQPGPTSTIGESQPPPSPTWTIGDWQPPPDDYGSDSVDSYDYGGDRSFDDYPSYDGSDLDCADIGAPVEVPPSDPHGLDADGDGIGCESYGYDPYEYDPYEYDPYEYDPYEYDPYEYDPYEYDPYEYDPYEYDPYEYDPYEYEP